MRLKKGQFCALDVNNEDRRKEYWVTKVQIIKRKSLFSNHYLCRPIDIVPTVTRADNHSIQNVMIHKSLLTPIEPDTRVLIRYPLNLPTFSVKDLEDLHDVCNNGNLSEAHKKKITKVALKIQYALQFNEEHEI